MTAATDKALADAAADRMQARIASERDSVIRNLSPIADALEAMTTEELALFVIALNRHDQNATD